MKKNKILIAFFALLFCTMIFYVLFSFPCLFFRPIDTFLLLRNFELIMGCIENVAMELFPAKIENKTIFTNKFISIFSK